MLLAAAVFAASPVLAAVDDEPAGLIPSSSTLARVRALYERAHARERGRNVMVMEEWRLFQDGIVGSYRVRRLGRDERDTTSLGPVSYERGVLRGTRWEQNRNGITYTYPGLHEARDAVSERALRDANDERDVHLIGESVPLAAYVVEVNPPNGRHAWYFIDKRSGIVVRRDRIERRRRYSTTYDDFRLAEGIAEPSRTRTVDSLGNEREQILVNRTFDDTPDLREVDMPASRRLVEFAEKSAIVRLPVRFVNGLLVVRVIVGRGAYDFLLDSGAAGIVVDPAVVEQQNLERFGQRVGVTMGQFPESTTVVPQMSVGSLRMRNVVARVVALPFHPDERTRIAGLLGFDFFADTVVHVDASRGIAEASAPERFRAPSDAGTLALDLEDKTPAVRVRAGSQNARAVVDTGANRSVFSTAFADRSDFIPDRASATRVRGVGGYALAETTRVPLFEIGPVVQRDVTVDVTSSDLGSEDLDGVIGSDLLRTTELWFDYRTDAIYLRRSPPALRPHR